jgi:beta-lactamase class A
MNYRTLSFILIAVTVMSLIGTTYAIFLAKNEPEACISSFKYISADVVCGRHDVISKLSYALLESEINKYIGEQQAREGVEEVSVYFRDLQYGPVMNINELANFVPASLFKLPNAFVFLASAESQPELLQRKISYSGVSSVSSQRIQPLQSALPEVEYTIEELLQMMISYSDNASYNALEAFILNDPRRESIRREVFQELGLIDPTSRIEEAITPRGYSSLFRVLYNVSYLSEEYSELLLSWLADSPYEDGLAAGVPESIVVAHKFGERDLPDGVKQLHDCGIVYFPDNPYFLCVMTQGTDWESIEETIATISEMVWNEVESRRL